MPTKRIQWMFMGAAETHIDFMRLRQLRRTEILDSGSNPEFDRLARLAAQLCDKAGAAIAFFDAERVWFKASYGAFTAEHVHPKFIDLLLGESRLLVVENCEDQSRLAEIEWPKGITLPGSFAAVPLTAGEGFVVGALCVFGAETGGLAIDKAQILDGLAHEIDAMVAGYKSTLRPQQTEMALAALDRAGEAVIVTTHGGDIQYANSTARTLFSFDEKSLASRSFIHLARALESRYSIAEGTFTGQLLPLLVQANVDQGRVLIIDASREIRVERVALKDQNAVAMYFSESKLNGFIPLGQMAGSLIHELNGSLAIVVGLARQIAAGEVAETGRREADQRLLRSSSLVSQLMLSVRELFTETNPKNVKVELSDCVKQAVELRSEAIARENVHLDLKISHATTMGRPVQLMQVFSSLLKDSIVSLRGADEKKIKIEMARQNDAIIISYWDSRVDLTEDKRAKLFNYFNQENPGHSESTLAMGLVDKMIRKHRGEVFLMNDVPGLSLQIRLPGEPGT